MFVLFVLCLSKVWPLNSRPSDVVMLQMWLDMKIRRLSSRGGRR